MKKPWRALFLPPGSGLATPGLDQSQQTFVFNPLKTNIH